MEKDKDGRSNNGGLRANSGRKIQIPYTVKKLTVNVPKELHSAYREMANRWIFEKTGYKKELPSRVSNHKFLFIHIPLDMEKEFKEHSKRWLDFKLGK